MMLEKYTKKDGEGMPPLDFTETDLKIPLVNITLAETPESPRQQQVIRTIIPILLVTESEAEKDKLIVSILPLACCNNMIFQSIMTNSIFFNYRTVTKPF